LFLLFVCCCCCDDSERDDDEYGVGVGVDDENKMRLFYIA